MTRIRLILGDQLNPQHSWFRDIDNNTVYLMAEIRQEAEYVRHHLQKLMAFFAAMRRFSEALRSAGHRVHYVRISDPDNPQKLEGVINQVVSKYEAEVFEYQLPDEYRLDEMLKNICIDLDIRSSQFDTEHFYTTRGELEEFFKDREQLLMEHFYRMMRKKHRILISSKDEPEGGQWNFDKSNRRSWKGTPPVPGAPAFNRDLTDLKKEIEESDIPYMGTADPSNFNWPLDREEALVLLDHFCDNLLPHFGDFQDAMHSNGTWLFHSRLSFALNSKIIGPREVIEKVTATYRLAPEKAHISQVEGFVRQILGWREYMRGIYWMKMPGYRELNYFGHENALPDFYWTGNTDMNCLKHCIKGSLRNAYAHHIQRLMVTGNFALLIRTNPDETDRWYLGIYIDAIEWVEITNTRGMSQYADGGLLATKPYISSANYIKKMSNYCKACKYDPNKRTGKDACPFNALYWNFLFDHQDLLRENPRMGMMYHLLDKIPENELTLIRERGNEIIANPDTF